MQDGNPEKHGEKCQTYAASPRHRPLQVLTRSGRYPGWRKCRFTFPHDIAMQWFFEAGFTARNGMNPA
jgi:hypothetical protein